ncbi:MAG: hypothetical protein GX893_04440 [Firmicutes bacterium]|nr:hypothetical protein [Bacillota bacterium]
MGQNTDKNESSLRWVVTITIWTFILSVIVSLVSQIIFNSIQSFAVALAVLLFIVITGILFDMIGIAAAAADEVPLLAKAAKKIPGAREALYLVRNADRFSNFCNDVVGDIAGIVSGVLNALLVLRLFGSNFIAQNPTVSIVATGIVSAITVGGKALGKRLALSRAADIILLFARFLTKIEAVLPGKVFFRNTLPPKRK